MAPAPRIHALGFSSAATPARATSVSWSSVPLLTPIAPTHWPSAISGMPPRMGVWRARLAMASPSVSTRFGWSPCIAGPLGARRMAEASALVMAICTEESFAPSMRAKASRCPPSSTTAMSIGTPICSARRSAASSTARAPSSVSFGLLRVINGMDAPPKSRAGCLAAAPELWGRAPALLRSQDLGIERGGRAAAGEHRDHVFCSNGRHPGARFDRGRSDVRRQDDVRPLHQTRMHLRLLFVHVEGGTGNLSGLERRQQRRLVHYRPPGGVD